MIEKLPFTQIDMVDRVEFRPVSSYETQHKINELVEFCNDIGNARSFLERHEEQIKKLNDAVNTIQKEREAERFEIQEWIGILEAVRKSVNVHEKQIDELQMKLEPEKHEVPAENTQDETPRCPFCGEELSYAQEIDGGFEILTCNCPAGIWLFGNDKMWYNLEKVITKLERTRKALDVARNGLEYIFGYEGVPEYVAKHVRQVLDQIKSETALEQKEE